MKKHMLVTMLTALFILTGCDEHIDPLDTSLRPCQILCTDGKVLTYEQMEQEGKTPIAVVFYANRGNENIEGSGYAVYLWDSQKEIYADSLGVNQATSADVSAYDGNSNTYAMYASGVSPAASSVFAIWRFGQSAFIPSVAEMKLLFSMRTEVNRYIEKCGGDKIPDVPEECWYWTSTEVAGQELHKAWLYSLSTGAMQETPKDEMHKIRPIISIYQ